MSKETTQISSEQEGSISWKDVITQRGMLDPTSQGPMLSDSPKTAKIMPINNPSSQNWTSTNTANLESNGVSVTIVSGSGINPACNKPTESVRGLINNSVTITPANVNIANGNELERRQFSTSGLSDGMAKCEHCGKRGVRDAFFTKKRNFCSNACVRAASKSSADAVEHSKLQGRGTKSLKPETQAVEFEQEESSRGSSIHDGGNRSTSSASNSYSDQDATPIKRNKLDMDQSYDWTQMLNESTFVAAKVASFKHAPVSSLWENVTLGMKVEVENTDVDQMSYQTAFWVASVIKIQGYKVLLRFEGFGNDSFRDFWVNLCSEDVHHVGWCATKGKPLIPPRSISGKFNDWREFLVKRLTGARTLPQNFQSKVASGLKSKFLLGTQLEVVDKNRICQLRLATVQKIVGKRLHVRYFDTDEDGGFWCHEDSPLIHPTGWARTVGHDIVASKSYHPDILPRSAFKFPNNYESLDLKEGMKLEAIDPLNLSAICAATIKKVLKLGYIMIRVDCYEEESNCGSDWFCYHVTSPYIFQCGFATSNGLVLTPPHGYSKDSFKWDNYLQATSSRAAPLRSLKKEPFEHDLEVNMRLEAADLMDPRLICVATISKVVGRLLKIHFDGWEEEYDQWLDAASPDIYPIGWCELVMHKLEPPRPPVVVIPQSKKGGKKGRKKTTGNRPPPGKVVTTKIGTKNPNRVSSTGKGSPQLPEGLSISSAPVPQYQGDGPSVSEVETSLRRRAATNNSQETSLMKPVETKVQEDSVNTQKKTDETDEMGLPVPVIPRLIGCPSISEMDEVDPQLWKVTHVKEFLDINECGAFDDQFKLKKVDGPKLMSLTKDQIILMTGMRVGPAVKILDLISQLKRLVQAARVRNSALSK